MADNLRLTRERRLVARGGFEPPKALGRQIYSLLHLTALQPPRRPAHGGQAQLPPARRVAGFPVRVRPLELAKGFEPPTR